jgi:hypothetical protein
VRTNSSIWFSASILQPIRCAIQRIRQDGGEDVFSVGCDRLLLELVVGGRLRVDAERGECRRDL